MNYTNYTDEALIDMLRSGDAEIADYLMEKYKPLVRKKTNAMYLIGGETEDLIQEGMIGLFKAMRDFDQRREVSFFSFAELCINRQLYSALEASNRKKHIPLNTYISFSNKEDADGVSLEQMLTDETASPEQLMIEHESKEEFFQRLQEKLSPMEKKVLYLYLEGHSYTQIAELMEKTPKSIDNSLQRIRTKIISLKDKI
ncbi:MAG: sigma-70 family RNA polymerase sigma factor [Agathobacter sp.]|nr:sigma-70 family RNA polymerase sigma factor [Agathobacter sp.]